jgi:hypothetical protein
MACRLWLTDPQKRRSDHFPDIHFLAVDNFQARKFEIFSKITRHNCGYGLRKKSC